MNGPRPRPDPYGALRLPEFRYWMGAAALATLASRALAVALGYQIYEELSHNPARWAFSVWSKRFLRLGWHCSAGT